jgi:uncharacterized membrane protein YjdF
MAESEQTPKEKHKLDWPKITGLFVFISLALATIYIVVVLVMAPAHAEKVFERTKSDYVLMLLQCLLGLAAIAIPSFLQKKLNFVIPSNMMVFYTLFLYGAIFLGEVMAFYYKVPHWDTVLHTLSGAMLGALGFSVITFLNKTDGIPINMSPLFVAFFAFCFAMTMGMIWEIYEFTVDYFFGTNMQKFALEGGQGLVGQAALMDTMKDLIVDTVGALVMSVGGYLSIKYKTGFVDKLIFKRRKGHK